MTTTPPVRPVPELPRGPLPISAGVLEFVPDPGRPEAWVVRINGALSSHVDLADPRHLDFDYMQWLASVLDLEPDRPDGLHVVHLGGGGCTLPQYLLAVRPAARQTVVELDPDVAREVALAFGLQGRPGLQIRVADALDALRQLPDASQDVVVRDAFVRYAVPAHLSDGEFHAEVRRVLRRPGRYLANVIDEAPFPVLREELRHLDRHWPAVRVVVDDEVAGGVKGNLVVVAGDREPSARLEARLARGAAPARLRAGFSDLLGTAGGQAVSSQGEALTAEAARLRRPRGEVPACPVETSDES